MLSLLPIITVHLSHSQSAFYAKQSFLDRDAEDQINWDQLDNVQPEWDRVESGIDDLLSLSTAYWEPGLGPRSPRRSGGDQEHDMRARTSLLERLDTEEVEWVEDGGNLTLPQLDKLMHQAMVTVKKILLNLERDKGVCHHELFLSKIISLFYSR